jgi:hypothetical protein
MTAYWITEAFERKTVILAIKRMLGMQHNFKSCNEALLTFIPLFVGRHTYDVIAKHNMVIKEHFSHSLP